MNSGIILIIIVAVFALIAIAAYSIHKLLSVRIKKDDKPTDEQIRNEEIDRVLEDVKDDKISKEIQDYKNTDEDDEK